MARYNPYNRGMMYPDVQDTSSAPYISYYDPQQVERIGSIIQQRGQRYDAAQSAIAKYLEEAGATEMRDPDKAGVMSWIANDLEKVKSNVKDRYNGDYGLAANEIIRSLAKSSNIYRTAGQKYKEEQKYLPLYQKLKSEGKLVTPKESVNPFEEQAFDESTGSFKPLDYSQMYERNDYNKWIGENISTRLNQNVTDNINYALKNASSGESPFLVAQKVKGMAQNKISENISDADVELFLQQNPTYAMEFEGDKRAAKNFMIETAKNQVYQQIDQQVINNPYWEQRQKETSKNDYGQYWYSLGDTLSINSPQKVALGLDDKYFDKSGKYIGNRMVNVPMSEEEHKSAVSGIVAGLGPSPQIAAGLKQVPSKDKENLQEFENFRKKYNLSGLNDRDTWKLMNKVENKLNEDFGTIWRVPETDKTSMNAITGNVFYNEKNNGFGDFVNRDIWINGEKVSDEDKVKRLKKELGVSSDKEFTDKLKSINGSLTFTGNSPAGIVGVVATKSGRQLKIEVSNNDQVAKEGKDMFEISSRLRNGNKDKFNLVNARVFKDKSTGKTIVSGEASIDIELLPDEAGELQPIPVIKYYNDKGEVIKKDTQIGIFGDVARQNIASWTTIPQ